MNGDPNQTSTKLRMKAIDIIRSMKRPMATHEIESWIRENDDQLATLINSKCSDYVRIILSVTQDNLIVKFKSLLPIEGVDKRSTFYGLLDETYSSDWVRCNGKSNRQIKKSSSIKKVATNVPKPQKPKQSEQSTPQSPSFEYSPEETNDDFLPMANIFEGIDLEAEWNQSPYMDTINFGF